MSYIIGAVCCAVLVFADQFTKWLAVTRLQPIRFRPFIPGFIEFRYHTNAGAAFGIMQGGRWVFLAFTAVVLGAMVYFYIKLPKNRLSGFTRALMAVIAAGALGNGIDRFRQGYVVDFLNFEFINFPVFNVADMYIVCGTILLSVLILFFYKEDPAKKKGKPGDDAADNGRP
ncbi:MAG: signal peptidase II [Defluviitaleaceae bacterium]|nr:signal peptidase II [Defluviitaleaceae bacterium]MCL2837104.1 signal peptidase II [Defluviitaleaceae bacterium]